MMNHWVYEKLSSGEKSLVDYQYERSGGFTTMLWKALFLADVVNLKKLERAFPSHVHALHKFRETPGWWPDLVRRLYHAPKVVVNLEDHK